MSDPKQKVSCGLCDERIHSAVWIPIEVGQHHTANETYPLYELRPVCPRHTLSRAIYGKAAAQMAIDLAAIGLRERILTKLTGPAAGPPEIGGAAT